MTYATQPVVNHFINGACAGDTGAPVEACIGRFEASNAGRENAQAIIENCSQRKSVGLRTGEPEAATR